MAPEISVDALENEHEPATLLASGGGRSRPWWPVRARVVIRLAASWREREELIRLRTVAYRVAGKHHEPGPMTDRWDERAILVGVYRDGVPVASARVIDCDEAEEWEHDRFVRWHEDWPPRSDCVEISRFCTLPDARTWDVIRAIGEGLGLAMIRTRKRYAIGCCTPELARLYGTFFGVRFTRSSIVHADLGPREHLMFWNDVVQRMQGKGIGRLAWLVLWPRVAWSARREGLRVRGGTRLGGAAHLLRVLMGLMLQGPANALVAWHRERRGRAG